MWKNTVRGESWHWEYFGTDPGGVCDADSAIGPDDTVDDDGPINVDGAQPEGDEIDDGEDAQDYSDENIPDDAPAESGETQTAAAHVDAD